MEIINQQQYDDWKAKQEDEYSLECFRYAERWADLMEKGIGEGKTLKSIAQSTSHDADTTGITGFMYGMAVSILSLCWRHGEELRRWSNLDLQIGNEGEEANENGEVLNPSLIKIVKK